MILTIVDENVGYSDGHYITVWWTGKMLWVSGQVTKVRMYRPMYEAGYRAGCGHWATAGQVMRNMYWPLKGLSTGRKWILGCYWTGNNMSVLATKGAKYW